MLVLTRKLNEVIRINDDIRIIVLQSAGNRIRLAIEAPSSVPVLREELWLRQQDLLSEAEITTINGFG